MRLALEEINTDDLTAQVGHVADLTWNHARALGSSSTTKLDGTLDVDGNTTLDTTVINESFDFDGGRFSVSSGQAVQYAEIAGERNELSSDFSAYARIDGVGSIALSPADSTFWDGADYGSFNHDSLLGHYYSMNDFAGTLATVEDTTAEWGVVADSIRIYTHRVDMNANLLVEGDSDLEGALDVDGDTQLDTTNIDGSLTVRDFADLNDSLDVAMDANFQSTVHIQDSLVVNGNSDMNGTLDVSGNTDIDGNLDVDGNGNVDGNFTVDGWSDLDSLHVAENADFDADVNIDGNSQTDRQRRHRRQLGC